MKRSLMVFTAIASFVLPALAPVATMAQDEQISPRERQRPQRTQPRDMDASPQQRRDFPRAERPNRPEGQARPERPQRPDQQPRPEWNRPDRPEGQRPNRPTRPDWNRPDRPNRPEQPNRPDRPDRPQQPDRPNRPDRPDWNRPDRPGAQRPDRPNRPDRPDWNRPDRPHRPGQPNRPNRPDRPNWNQDRDYRDFHNRWNRDQWRRDWDRRHRGDWWRHDNRFRGWNGVRIGFYFAPGYGYYSVPRSYWNRQYYVGQYLPDIFWRYQVNDWRTYGLGYPPPGTRWVYVDNAIYLIDEYDGYIIEVVRDAWSW
ncbi:RcnB family protein [Brevundimonas faecalis]|uniref:RcnB family protein n=1 Tax=Brevundimonas faecalis TaxID=947378 RepID=UPI003612A684